MFISLLKIKRLKSNNNSNIIFLVPYKLFNDDFFCSFVVFFPISMFFLLNQQLVVSGLFSYLEENSGLLLIHSHLFRIGLSAMGYRQNTEFNFSQYVTNGCRQWILPDLIDTKDRNPVGNENLRCGNFQLAGFLISLFGFPISRELHSITMPKITKF